MMDYNHYKVGNFTALIKRLSSVRVLVVDGALAERDRWFLWVPAFIAVGIGVYFSLPFEPSLWWSAALLLLPACLFVMRFRLSGICLFLLLTGFAAAQVRTISLDTFMMERSIGPASLSGRVISLEHLNDGMRVVVDRIRISSLEERKTPGKIRLKLRGTNPALTPGDWIEGRVIVSPPSPPALPDGFDFQRHMYFKEIGGLGYNIGPVKLISESGQDTPIHWLAMLRQRISERVYEAMGSRAGGLAVALMTGMRGWIPSQTMDAIRNSGLAHLLAISGLHIGLVSGILFVTSRGVLSLVPWIALNIPIKKWTAVIALIGALCYVLISGVTIPTQRAFLMVAIVLLAVIVDRRGLSMRLVAWAATLILLLQPESLLSASFQMSFSAVVALIATYEYLRNRRLKLISRSPAGFSNRLWFYLGGVLLTTFIAGMATAPAAIYHFNQFVNYGLIANLIAVPITAMWIMPWAIVALVLMPFGMEIIALTPMGWGLEVVMSVSELVATLPGAVTLLPSMPVWGFLLIILGGLWVCLWQKSWRFYGTAVMMVGAASIYTVNSPDLIIDGKGRVLAARTNMGTLSLSSIRRAKFETGIWLRQDGTLRPKTDWGAGWPQRWSLEAAGIDSVRTLYCDINGCLYQAEGQTVALVHKQDALIEDCWSADFVVSLEPIRNRCPARAGKIDWFDLWREGTHAMWLSPDKIIVKSVNGERGYRPWVVRNKSRKPNANISTGFNKNISTGGVGPPSGPGL